jgi:glycosyltransferase involved in cell wall biosynthesis
MNKAKIMVSVCMITYNHEPYIRQAIESVMMQKCDFSFELVIGEDCSTDNTKEICSNYAIKFPEIILLPSEINIGMIPNFIKTLQACNGKYIAICEGDDYWTDPYKLQKQINFLEKNSECSVCFHPHQNLYNDGKLIIQKPNRINGNIFSIKAIILGGGVMATNTMFFLKDKLNNYPDWAKNAPVGDLPLKLILASSGKVGYIDDLMSVYRINSNGSWTSTFTYNEKKRKKHLSAMTKVWDEFDNWTSNKYHSYVIRKKIKNRWNYYKGKILRKIRY